MQVKFTNHAKYKFVLLEKADFPIRRQQVINCLKHPLKTEPRIDDTFINTIIITENHVLRVVYKTINDTILVITFYPGRKQAYGF